MNLNELFATVTTPNVADAAMRRGVSFFTAPSIVRPLFPHARVAGRALPVTHFGSVDVFLEAMESAGRGDVLVIDNQNRHDEACIGDLTVIEAKMAGIAGVVLWGALRDTVELIEIGLPVFATGATPIGPRGVRPRATTICDFAGFTVTREHVVFADADGVLFVPAADAVAVLHGAAEIAETERRQAANVREGRSLRTQLRFSQYLAARQANPAFTFREHLAGLGGAIEV